MSIASELQNYADGLDDAYDAVNDMSGIIPQHKNMNNLDQAIRTIPQSQGATYTAGNGINIDANNEISIDDTVVAELSDLPVVMTGATSGAAGTSGLVPAPAAGDDGKVLSGAGTWVNQPTVPTVNDATLTIQHNNTTVQTFTANQSTAATANIETIYATTVAPASQVAPITTNQIQDEAVTAAKIDFTSFIAGTADFTAVSAGGSNDVSVNIPTQANTDYLIFLQLAGHTGYWTDLVYRPGTKTTTSFTITAYNSGNGATGSFSINYLVIPQ